MAVIPPNEIIPPNLQISKNLISDNNPGISSEHPQFSLILKNQFLNSKKTQNP
jgi:hypothetical protein